MDELLVCPDIPAEWNKVTVGSIIIGGLLIAYGTQIAKIIKTKSSHGLSPYFLLLSGIDCACTTFNVLLLQYFEVRCCFSVWSTTFCWPNLMGIFQVLVQFVSLMTIFTLFYIYFPIDRRSIPSTKPKLKSTISHEWKLAIIVAILVFAFNIIVAVISIVLLTPSIYSSHTNPNAMRIQVVRGFGGTLGIIALVCSGVKFLPQLIQTWKDKRVGALSIPTLAISAPGAFLSAYALMIQPGTDWTSWIAYIASGILQMVLFGMCVAWYFREKKLKLSSTISEKVVSDDFDDNDDDFMNRREEQVFLDDDPPMKIKL